MVYYLKINYSLVLKHWNIGYMTLFILHRLFIYLRNPRVNLIITWVEYCKQAIIFNKSIIIANKFYANFIQNWRIFIVSFGHLPSLDESNSAPLKKLKPLRIWYPLCWLPLCWFPLCRIWRHCIVCFFLLNYWGGGYSGPIYDFFKFACSETWFGMMFAKHLCTFENICNFQLHSTLGAWGKLLVNTTIRPE